MATTTPTRVTAPPPVGTDHRRFGDGQPFHWTALWIAVVLIAILSIAILVGSLIHNLNATRMVAIFAIGVVSFLGMLGITHRGSGRQGFEPAEVRTALTTAFTMVFFAAVGIFLFSTNQVGDFGRTLMDNLTSLFGVVIGFYFASSAAVEFAKIRERTKFAPATNAAGVPPDQPPVAGGSGAPDTALHAEIAALKATVEELANKLMAGDDGKS